MTKPGQLRPDLHILAEARELHAEAEDEGLRKETLRRQLIEDLEVGDAASAPGKDEA